MAPRPELRHDPITVTSRGKWRLPDMGQYGPAMAALRPKQRKFVEIYHANGGNGTRAYIDAGYGGSSEDARGNASHLLQDPKIQSALVETARGRTTGKIGVALDVVAGILEDPGTLAKDKIAAAKMLMDRGGLHGMIEQKITHEHTLNYEQLVAKAKLLEQRLGRSLPAGIIERSKPVAEDVEFEDIEPDPAGREGLEDFL